MNKVIAAVVGVLAPALTGVAAARPQIVDGVFRAGTKRGMTDEPEDGLKGLLPPSSPCRSTYDAIGSDNEGDQS